MSNGCGFHMGWTIHQWFMSIIFRSKTWVTDAKKRAWNTRRMSDTRFFGGNLGIFLCLINEFVCVGSSVAAVLSKPIHWTYPSISHSPIAVSHAFWGRVHHSTNIKQQPARSVQPTASGWTAVSSTTSEKLEVFPSRPCSSWFRWKGWKPCKERFVSDECCWWLHFLHHSFLFGIMLPKWVIFLMWNH
jgi:hypothetical protein